MNLRLSACLNSQLWPCVKNKFIHASVCRCRLMAEFVDLQAFHLAMNPFYSLSYCCQLCGTSNFLSYFHTLHNNNNAVYDNTPREDSVDSSLTFCFNLLREDHRIQDFFNILFQFIERRPSNTGFFSELKCQDSQ